MSTPTTDDTLGALFIGYSISSILYGITCVQVFMYVTSARRKTDSRSLHAFVFILFFLDSAHTVLTMMGLYRIFVTSFAQTLQPQSVIPASLVQGIEMVNEEAAFGLLVILFVQLFFARRVWLAGSIANFRKGLRTILTCATIGLALMVCASNIAITIRALEQRKSYNLFNISTIQLKTRWELSFSGTILCDVIIAGAMVAMLRLSRTGAGRSDGVLRMIILFTINTGLVTTLLTIAALVQYLVVPSALFYVGIEILIPKSYCNSALAALNTRDYLREKLTGYESSFHLPSPVVTSYTRRNLFYDENPAVKIGPSLKSPKHFVPHPPKIEWEPPTRTPSPIVFAERPLPRRQSQP